MKIKNGSSNGNFFAKFNSKNPWDPMSTLSMEFEWTSNGGEIIWLEEFATVPEKAPVILFFLNEWEF